MTHPSGNDAARVFRKKEWRSDLIAWAHRRVGAPFEWGVTDCASLAREALEVMFGFDLVPDIPRWTTLRVALSSWQEHGPLYKKLAAFAPASGSINFLRAGDIIVLSEPGETVGGEAVLVTVDGMECVTSGVASGVIRVRADQESFEAPPRIYSIWEVDRNG